MTEGEEQKPEGQNRAEKTVQKSFAGRSPWTLDKVFAAVFLIAVPAVVAAAAVLLKGTSSDSEISGSGRGENPRVMPREAGVTAQIAPDQGDRLEFVGEDAPLTPLNPFRSIVVPGDADEPFVLESWKNGGAKTVSREWSFEGSAIEELCWFEQDGSPVGCGVLKDGERWEGAFAQWGVPAGKFQREATVLREIVCYKNGQKDGLARSYRYDGKPLLETFFSAGKQVRKRVFRQQDNRVVDLGSMRLEGLPESRRTRNTVK